VFAQDGELFELCSISAVRCHLDSACVRLVVFIVRDVEQAVHEDARKPLNRQVVLLNSSFCGLCRTARYSCPLTAELAWWASATMLPCSMHDWLCIMTELRISGLLAH
jgi:hypothetical protein